VPNQDIRLPFTIKFLFQSIYFDRSTLSMQWRPRPIQWWLGGGGGACRSNGRRRLLGVKVAIHDCHTKWQYAVGCRIPKSKSLQSSLGHRGNLMYYLAEEEKANSRRNRENSGKYQQGRGPDMRRKGIPRQIQHLTVRRSVKKYFK
jgi:hypothetical protein